MPRERVIVSIGEALLSERRGNVEPGGLAMNYAQAAAKAGFRGAAVSRIGQDESGEQLLQLARERDIDVEHVQSDPDLPTARLLTRTVAGQSVSILTANAAFDNLQWDFDLIDLAQRAEAVFFGQLARRNGQAKSVIKQFLLECSGGGAAMRVFDLTNRGGDAVDRAAAWTGLEFCEVLISDARGLSALAPTAAGNVEAAAKEVLRATGVKVVIASAAQNDQQRLTAFSSGETIAAASDTPVSAHETTMMRLVTRLIDGEPLAACMRDISGAA